MGHTRFNKFIQLGVASPTGVTPLAVSGTNTYLSPVSEISQMHNIGVQAVFVGTMSGTFSVQASADNVNFDTYSFTPALSQPAGSNTIISVALNQIPFQYIRVKYVNASGSGTVQCILNSKDLS